MMYVVLAPGESALAARSRPTVQLATGRCRYRGLIRETMLGHWQVQMCLGRFP